MLKVPLEMPVPAAVPSVQIIRAVLREYHPATHTAEVEPVLGPASLVGEIPVLMSCLPDLLTTGRQVAVLTWSDVGGLVLGPYGAVPPPCLWGDGSDGAIGNLTDSDTQATTTAQTSGVTLTHNRTIRATGNITLSQAITVSKQNGQARPSAFPATHGGQGLPLADVLATLGSKGIPNPIRPGGGNTGLCGGVVQFLSGGTVAIGGAITAQGTNAASDGGGGGGLVVVVAKTSITGSSAIDVSAANGHATPAAKGGAGSYSGAPGGHAGIGGCGGGGNSVSGGTGGAGYITGKRGGYGTGWHGCGGGGLEAAGANGGRTNGGRGGIASFNWARRLLGLVRTPTAGTDADVATAGADGGGGAGGDGNASGKKPGGNGGDNGSGGGSGGTTQTGQGDGYDGGNGANGGTGCFSPSCHSVFAGCPGGQGGGGGGGGGGAQTGTAGSGGSGGSGASGASPIASGQGAGSGGAGANGANGANGSVGGTPAPRGNGGAGGSGGNGGGAAGLVLLIAPTITYSGTVTGRLVKITGTDALDFIRGYYVD